MSKPKHTPGPWNWSQNLNERGKFDGTATVFDNNERLGYMYRDVARLPACKPQKEMEANARLIAAAPEMLEALRAIRDEIPGECDCDDDDVCSFHKAKGLVNLAIDKAEGRDK